MDTNAVSREPVPANPPAAVPATLAQVAEALLTVPGLTVAQRADLRSAVKVAARTIGRPMDSVPSSPNMLRELLDRHTAASAGMSQAGWRNLRSRLNAALRHAGVPAMLGRRVFLLAPAWQALYDRLPDRRQKAAVSRFMTYCSGRGILPGDVTVETFTAFRDSLELLSLRTNPRRGYVQTCQAWEHARRRVQDWPDVDVETPRRDDRYALPWETFPASLKADVDDMVADAAGHDITAMKARRRLRPASLAARAAFVRRVASAYVHAGGEPADLRTLADLVRLPVLRRAFRYLIGRFPSGRAPTLHTGFATLAAIARQWVGVSREEQAELDRIKRNLSDTRYEMTPETRALLQQFDDPGRLARLFEEPAACIERVARMSSIRETDAVTAAAALAVRVLIDVPLRIGNAVAIDLGRHLVRVRREGGFRYHLAFAAEEVKNGQALELPLSAETTRLVDLYLERIRPILLRGLNTHLFPGAADGPKTAALLSLQIARFTHDRIGVRLTAHKFRHLAGYLYLKHNPTGHEVVRQLLGHRDINTTIRFYASLSQAEALDLYDRTVERLHAESRQAAPAPRRRSRR